MSRRKKRMRGRREEVVKGPQIATSTTENTINDPDHHRYYNDDDAMPTIARKPTL